MTTENKNLIDDLIAFNNFAEIVTITGSQKVGSNSFTYTVSNKNGTTFFNVPGMPGMVDRATMGFVNGDKSRPILIGTALKATETASTFTYLKPPWGNTATYHGYDEPSNSRIETVQIPTLGNATQFGQMRVTMDRTAGASSGTLGLWAWGTGGLNETVIEQITFATAADSTNWGDTGSGLQGRCSVSSLTRAVWVGGISGAVESDTMEYHSFASAGAKTDFGDLSVAKQGVAGTSDGVKGIMAGGTSPGVTFRNEIETITIATTGNATDVADLTDTRQYMSGFSSTSRAVFAGGQNSGADDDDIDFVTYANTANATNFGTLLAARSQEHGAASNGTRGVITGGTGNTTMDYITIATEGNGASFGITSDNNRGLYGISGD